MTFDFLIFLNPPISYYFEGDAEGLRFSIFISIVNFLAKSMYKTWVSCLLSVHFYAVSCLIIGYLYPFRYLHHHDGFVFPSKPMQSWISCHFLPVITTLKINLPWQNSTTDGLLFKILYSSDGGACPPTCFTLEVNKGEVVAIFYTTTRGQQCANNGSGSHLLA